MLAGLALASLVAVAFSLVPENVEPVSTKATQPNM